MRVVRGINALEPALGRLFVVVGVFDGLHRGHAYLLRHLVRAAAERDARATVVTFDHHPDEVLTGAAPPLLCDPRERIDRLGRAGVEITVVQTFDVALRMTPYDEFVRRIAERVELVGFLMTPESAFGHDRAGTPETVAALGTELGYDVLVVPPFTVHGRPVRSTDIRAAIAAGDLPEAERLLGQPYAVIGESRPVAGGDVPLEFPMPVALPPPGSYTGLVGPASRATTQTPARVDIRPDGSVTVASPSDARRATGSPRRVAPAGRLRLVFVGPAPA
jgi:riboflavin kinase / FMN adenylyltransferase